MHARQLSQEMTGKIDVHMISVHCMLLTDTLLVCAVLCRIANISKV